MSQTFDTTKPESGVTKMSELYQIIRDHDQANQSSFSGSSAPGTPVAGQHWYDTTNEKLYCYTAGSGWAEVAISSKGIGQEIITARGSHSSLDSRLDAQLNEDGTLKASTSLNPSQWYDLTVASGYVSSTTSFKAFGANYTTVYYATRRLKVNRAAGTYYTEVVSSSYSAPDTTVVIKDEVIASDLYYVSHSIVSPRKASGGDGAVSYEMIANKNTVTKASSTTATLNDSVIFLNGVYTTTLPSAVTFGAGRMLFLINIHASATHTVAGGGGQTINGGASVSVLAGQSLIIVSDGSNWYRLDQPVTSVTWSDIGNFGSGWSAFGVAKYTKDLLGWVHLTGAVINGSHTTTPAFQLPSGFRPVYDYNGPVCAEDESANLRAVHIDTSGYATGRGIYMGLSDVNIAWIRLDGITFKAA